MNPPSQGPAIEARQLRKTYGELVALEGLDLEVPRGTCLGLLGPNGAGKTTTISILVGLLESDSGEARILGLDWKADAATIRQRIGVQLQETQFNDKLQVVEVLRLFRSFYDSGSPVEEVLELVALTEKARARYVTLSGGQKQRLALGCALVSKPEVLFLDEPTTGLDPQARRRVWEIIADFKRQGGTVLLTTHYMDEAEQLSDWVVIVDQGHAIAEGTPEEIIRSLGAENVVQLTLGESENGDDDEAWIEIFQSLDTVHSARSDAGVLNLCVDAAHSALPQLLDTIASRQAQLLDLRTHRPTLEDVFVSLTGKQLRDG